MHWLYHLVLIAYDLSVAVNFSQQRKTVLARQQELQPRTFRIAAFAVFYSMDPEVTQKTQQSSHGSNYKFPVFCTPPRTPDILDICQETSCTAQQWITQQQLKGIGAVAVLS
ncbi:hypothetical protein ABBQ32_002976 [Trebouxia sp. C0010 RCD-2024]